VIRTGVVLPTFRESPADALGAADAAVAAGVDGLFCYDHIWPLGQPQRPALAPFPILGALAARFAPRGDGGPFVGSLVARVGLVPDDVLFEQFVALDHLAPGRVIAALGTGDHMSAAENRAYGIAYPPAAARRTAMVALARRLRAQGLSVWIAGGSHARTDESDEAGAALNLWDVDPALVADRAGGPDGLEVTWAGPPPTVPLAPTLAALAGAGAAWAVFGWPVDVDELVAAARAPVPG
jgi:alkanesulfonate monooxygenase SsuD/methylene tetrahydromethanopterin reductase-like flavin-dependent oxidoreductase (luciferase family)